MARCNSCSKMVSYDAETDPEDVEVSVDGTSVMMSCTITLNCADCGDVMKTGALDADGEVNELQEHIDKHEQAEREGEPIEVEESEKDADGKVTITANYIVPFDQPAEFEVAETGSTRTDRYEGKGRGAKHFYGAEVSYKVTCTACEGWEYEGTISADIQSSSMDEA